MDFDALMEWYAAALLGQLPCMRMTDTTGRKQLMNDPHLKAVIYHTVKFCDYYGFEYSHLRRELTQPDAQTGIGLYGPEQWTAADPPGSVCRKHGSGGTDKRKEEKHERKGTLCRHRQRLHQYRCGDFEREIRTSVSQVIPPTRRGRCGGRRPGTGGSAPSGEPHPGGADCYCDHRLWPHGDSKRR